MEMQQPRECFYEDEDFNIETNIYESFLVLHCTVTNWKPSVLRMGLLQFARLEQWAIDQGFERMITITPNPKFVEILGGQTVEEFEYENKQYKVVVWDLKQQQ